VVLGALEGEFSLERGGSGSFAKKGKESFSGWGNFEHTFVFIFIYII
jgi:hypothetical protein